MSTETTTIETGTLTGTYDVDATHSRLGFAAKHAMVATVRGGFKVYSGEVFLDEENPQNSWAKVEIDVASVDTGNADRDAHLLTPDFFDVANHAKITFVSTKVEKVDDDVFTLIGDLTIKGVTHPVTLNVVKYGEFNDPGMGHRIGYAAETKINRKDFGMQFDMMLDGKFIVSNEIQINIEGELVEAKEKEPAGTTSSSSSSRADQK